MMRFLFGQDTTKKNERLLWLVREVLDEGHEAILLVPEQDTVTLERRMVEALPPQAQLSFEVSNFSRLANRIFRTVGGLSYRYATPGATALVMWRTLCKVAPMLTQYAAHAATDLHLTEQMLGAVMQFKAYAITPEQLTTAAEALPEHDPLSQKLKDLALVYATYVADLGERYDDTADDIARATKLILANRAVLAKTHIFISSFTDFTAAEMGLIHALLDVCPEVTVLSPLSDLRETGIHLASASATCHKLIALCPAYGEDNLPVAESLIETFHKVTALMRAGKVYSAYTPTLGGIAEAVYKMCIGNGLGFKFLDEALSVRDIFGYCYGSFLLEVDADTEGQTVGIFTDDGKLTYGSDSVAMAELDKLYEE
ncbi:MAG: hypothetical protein IJF31_04205, partial [Clostridia bacterium]|nr:hypothetical protein [Clostridia bacterium]